MYTILCGIPAMNMPKGINGVNENGVIEDYEVEDAAANPWCDFELDYFPNENRYGFSFETMLGFRRKEGCRDWIISCLATLMEYMQKKNYDTSKEINMYDAFTEGYNVNTHFNTIEEAFAWLKMMVFGFHGEGLYDGKIPGEV